MFTTIMFSAESLGDLVEESKGEKGWHDHIC